MMKRNSFLVHTAIRTIRRSASQPCNSLTKKRMTVKPWRAAPLLLRSRRQTKCICKSIHYSSSSTRARNLRLYRKRSRGQSSNKVILLLLLLRHAEIIYRQQLLRSNLRSSWLSALWKSWPRWKNSCRRLCRLERIWRYQSRTWKMKLSNYTWDL